MNETEQIDDRSAASNQNPPLAAHLQTQRLLEHLQGRLQRLERLGASGILIALAGVVGAFAAGRLTAPPSPAEQSVVPADATFANIICRSITVTDPQDMPRVQLDTTQDGSARILVRDQERRERFILESKQIDETSLDIRDASGKTRVMLASLRDNSCGIDLADQHGSSRVMLLIDEDGGCSIAQADAEGRERLAHEILPAGNPVTRWQDREGTVRLAALVQDGLGCAFDTNDAAQHTRIRSFTRDDGESGLMILDATEESRILLGTEAGEGASMAYWWDAEGELRLVAGTVGEELVAPVTDVKQIEANPDQPKAGWPKVPDGR